MTNADDFIELFNRADLHVRMLADRDRTQSFSVVLVEAAKRNSVVRRRKDMLLSYANLRNAIVHDRSYPKRIIAEPLPEAVDDLRRVVEALIAPTRLIPAFRRQVRCFTSEDPLADALRYMRSEDYSQIVVRDSGRLSMLTDEGIGRWLEASVCDDVISLAEQRVGNALAHQPAGSFKLLRAGDAVDDAIEAFATALTEGSPRLYSVLVTERGRADEQPLGIITPWDLFSFIGRS